MTIDVHGSKRLPQWLARIAAMVLAVPVPAWAALGADEATVAMDNAQIRGTLRVVRAATHSVHEIAAPSGAVVREYVSPAGKVFAVAWQGPRLPDLRQVLGEHFDAYVAAAASRRFGRGPVLIEQPGLVVHSSGHMRAFVGQAYVPALLPPGVAVDALR
jgi:hypothetical protein